jgi:exopolyphosphatase/guanosine-5'-triphosphate,3'-diphosphate pyrophosphatase
VKKTRRNSRVLFNWQNLRINDKLVCCQVLMRRKFDLTFVYLGQMNKVAVIDLGTNTFNLLIAEILGNKDFRKILSDRVPVMLGEGTITSGLISPVPFERGIAALKKFRGLIEKEGVKKVIVLATSAIRTAKNGIDFIRAAKAEAFFEVEIISGDREAELIYLGNAAATSLGSKPSLIMDIGGGSTEFVIGNNSGILWAQSFLLGAARLLERFKPEDPVSENTIKKIENYFDTELQPLFAAVEKFPVTELIGSSGAFDSFAELIDASFGSMNYSDEKISYEYNLEEFNKVRDKIVASTLSQRKVMEGLLAMRVEMIVVSFIFVNYILKRTGLKKLRSTTWSLKEGAIVEYLASL